MKTQQTAIKLLLSTTKNRVARDIRLGHTFTFRPVAGRRPTHLISRTHSLPRTATVPCDATVKRSYILTQGGLQPYRGCADISSYKNLVNLFHILAQSDTKTCHLMSIVLLSVFTFSIISQLFSSVIKNRKILVVSFRF